MTEPVFVDPSGSYERTENDRIIVSAGIGEHYLAGLASTRAHCAVHAPEAWQLMYTYYPEGCPPHEKRQYAFKIFALRRAIAAGFRYVVWMDSTFQPIGSMQPLWDCLTEHGWYVPPQQGLMLDRFVSDEALSIYDITRAEAAAIPLVYSGLVAFDMRVGPGRYLWRLWEDLYERGAFNGAHLNKPDAAFERWGEKFSGHVSDDVHVEGHRHDEAALSYALSAWRLEPPNLGFLTYEDPRGFLGHHVPLNYRAAVGGLWLSTNAT